MAENRFARTAARVAARQDARAAELGCRSCVEDVERAAGAGQEDELARRVPVAVQDEVAAPVEQVDQLAAEPELRCVGPAEERGEALSQVVLGEPVEVVMEHEHDEAPARRRVDGAEHRGDVVRAQHPVAPHREPVVRAGRVEADRAETRPQVDLDARARHEEPRRVVAQPVVIAGDDDESLAQRREQALEGGELARAAAVRHVSREQHLVDRLVEERVDERRGRGVRLRVAPDVQVGDVRKRPRRRHGGPLSRDRRHGFERTGPLRRHRGGP
jgi:hypothetical protein